MRKSFYLQSEPNINSMTDYVFDDVYKNKRERTKLQQNPQFTYYKMIAKMKN